MASRDHPESHDPLLPSTSTDEPTNSPARSDSGLASINNILSALHSASRLGRGDSRLPRLPLVRLQLRHASDDEDQPTSLAGGTGPATATATPVARPVSADDDDGTATRLHRREPSIASSGRQDSNVAASAERHRLHNATVVDLQATARWVESSLCFFGLLLVVFLYHHLAGLLVFSWLTFVLVKANDVLRRQAALKERRKGKQLLGLALGLLLHVPLTLWLLKGQQLWLVFGCLPPPAIETVWDAFFMVAVVDLLIRYCGMALKVALLLMLPTRSAEQIRARGQVLTAVEHALLLYRAATPTSVWYKYYLSRKLPSFLFSSCTGVYVVFKISMLYERLVAMVTALKLIVRPEGQYGQYASESEVAEAGNQCAICQEPMLKPIKLQCTHLFCEACIAEWFERERTCPMCRAVAKPAGLASFRDGSTSLLPQLF